MIFRPAVFTWKLMNDFDRMIEVDPWAAFFWFSRHAYFWSRCALGLGPIEAPTPAIRRQFRKKVLEAMRCANEALDRAVRELHAVNPIVGEP